MATNGYGAASTATNQIRDFTLPDRTECAGVITEQLENFCRRTRAVLPRDFVYQDPPVWWQYQHPTRAARALLIGIIARLGHGLNRVTGKGDIF